MWCRLSSPMSPSFVGRDPCPAADALVGLTGSCWLHKQPGEGARRGSGVPPHENCADLGRLTLPIEPLSRPTASARTRRLYRRRDNLQLRLPSTRRQSRELSAFPE